MAIGFDAVTGSTYFNVTSKTFAHTVGAAGANRLLLVVVNHYNVAGDYVSGVTYAGSALTLYGQIKNLTSDMAERWGLVAPAPGAYNVVITFAGTGQQGECAALSFTGVDQSTPLGSGTTGTGFSTAPSVTVTCATGDWAVDTLAWYKGGGATATMTADSGRTQRHNSGGGDEGCATSEDQSTSTSEAMNWTLSVTAEWAMVSGPIKPAAGGTIYDKN